VLVKQLIKTISATESVSTVMSVKDSVAAVQSGFSGILTSVVSWLFGAQVAASVANFALAAA